MNNFIEQAVMSADPEEEGVLLAEFEQVLKTPPLRPGLEEMVAMDVEADLKEIRQPLWGCAEIHVKSGHIYL